MAQRTNEAIQSTDRIKKTALEGAVFRLLYSQPESAAQTLNHNQKRVSFATTQVYRPFGEPKSFFGYGKNNHKSPSSEIEADTKRAPLLSVHI